MQALKIFLELVRPAAKNFLVFDETKCDSANRDPMLSFGDSTGGSGLSSPDLDKAVAI